eukprot:Ihof_evm8s231 gene=Ihof_evmTU8s231
MDKNIDENSTSDSETCPKCARDRGLNKNMIFMVSVCGHKVCEDCKNRMYGINHTTQCHQCKQLVTKSQWQQQKFEDIGVQKEVQIRAKFIKEWNKTREDFRTLYDYNDYLEAFEDIIYNLVHNENVEEAKAQLEKNRQENSRLIQRNQERQDREEQRVEQEIAEEERLRQIRWAETLDQMQKEKQDRRQQEQNLIENLAKGDRTAEEVIKEHEKLQARIKAAKASAQKTVVDESQAQGQGRIPVPIEEQIPYEYKAPIMELDGPSAPICGDGNHSPT